jgi:hypothetical protein
MHRRQLGLALAMALAPWHAGSQEAPPEWAAAAGLQPQNRGRLTVWGFEVYDARLWTAPDFELRNYPRTAFALELQYLRALSGPAIAERSLEEMRRLAPVAADKASAWLDAMRRIFPDVARGDRIVGVHLPGQGAEFWLNGRRIGRVADPQFSQLFLGIWLDERTSEPRLRAQLVQGLRP